MSTDFRILELNIFERGVTMRLPFRFGVVTLSACPQAFVQARIRLADGREAVGASAELMVPKWFDKNLALSNEENFAQLRRSLLLARDAYLSDGATRSAFGHFAAHYQPHIDAAALDGLNPLIACYGPALLDRAVLDALCRALGVSFYDAVRHNTPGIDARLCPDLARFDIDAFLQGLSPSPRIHVRHTVGLLDPIVRSDVIDALDDGLPETLEEVVATYGCRYFKLKVCGKTDEDIDRLTRIAAVLDRLPEYVVTLDGNEQFSDADAAARFWQRALQVPALRRLTESTLYVEQPLPRAIALAADVSRLAAARPVLIDESDATLEAFPTALGLGYTGVSSKDCKGVYRSLLNAARCAQRNATAPAAAPYFMSAEDLTTQAGLAVQQDLALVNLLGLTHVERNGHHYVDGFAGQGAGAEEQQAFLAAHPNLYQRGSGTVRLHIENGSLELDSLALPGFASGAHPVWETLEPMVVRAD